jgi:hypothetical protein
VYGSLPAEKCVELIEGTLLRFEISYHDDIVGITTGEASVRRKVGKLSSADSHFVLYTEYIGDFEYNVGENGAI